MLVVHLARISYLTPVLISLCLVMMGFLFAQVYFGCSASRYHLAFHSLGISCFTGMSYLVKKPELDNLRGLSWFGRFLAEDFFIAKLLHDRYLMSNIWKKLHVFPKFCHIISRIQANYWCLKNIYQCSHFTRHSSDMLYIILNIADYWQIMLASLTWNWWFVCLLLLDIYVSLQSTCLFVVQRIPAPGGRSACAAERCVYYDSRLQG